MRGTFWIRSLRTFLVCVIYPLSLIGEKILKWTLFMLSIPLLGAMGAFILIGAAGLFIAIPLGILGVLAENPHGWDILNWGLKWGGFGALLYMGGFGAGYFYARIRETLKVRILSWWKRTDPDNRTVNGGSHDRAE